MVVEGAFHYTLNVGRICRRVAAVVWVPNGVPAAVDQELSPPAVQRESQTAPDLVKSI